jgi:tetratricopeptide (TPR) repeat protein
MNILILVLLLQTAFPLPPRTALQNPAVASPVPPKLQKDYDKLWNRFVAGKEDAKVYKDLDKLLQKQKTFQPALMIQAYLALYRSDGPAARQKLEQVIAVNPGDRTAIYYLAELEYSLADYSRAASLYAQLIAIGAGDSEIETKRQKAVLLATENLYRAAARAESENRLGEAESYYRQAVRAAPDEPSLRLRLADILRRQNKNDEADAELKTADALGVRRASDPRGADASTSSDLEDLGRWGNEIDVFREIRSAPSITREQLALLLVRYFPQITELQQTPQILTDIENSTWQSAIQTTAGLGLLDPRPNRTFEPLAPVTRADLAASLARFSRLINVPEVTAASIFPPDVAPTNAMFGDVQLVLISGLMTLQNSGAFGLSDEVSGEEAVHSTERLLRIFQQSPR